MGVYSINTISSIGNIQVEAATGYNDNIGVQLAMIEAYQNDLAIFDNTIMGDFREAGMVLEGASMDELRVVQEGSMGDFLETIKQFFVKLWEKIKGIFNGFMAKLDSHVMKDSKAFHDKYSKVVYNKDLSKMKVRFSKPKPKKSLSTLSFSTMDDAELNAYNLSTKSDLDKTVEDFDRDEFICKILNSCSPSVNISEEKEFVKDMHEALWEDEDEQDGCAAIIHDMGNILVTKNAITNVTKANTSLEKAISNMIKEIEKSKSAVIKLLPGKDGAQQDIGGVKTKFGVDKDGDGKHKSAEGYTQAKGTSVQSSGARNIQKALNFVHTQATCIQSAALKFTGVCLSETKFEIAQARRIFAAAVAYNPKSVKESATLMEAMEESAVYEVMSSFECY